MMPVDTLLLTNRFPDGYFLLHKSLSSSGFLPPVWSKRCFKGPQKAVVLYVQGTLIQKHLLLHLIVAEDFFMLNIGDLPNYLLKTC